VRGGAVSTIGDHDIATGPDGFAELIDLDAVPPHLFLRVTTAEEFGDLDSSYRAGSNSSL
jgi:hypothetical protein